MRWAATPGSSDEFDERGGGGDLCRQLVDLVLHQSDQRREDERRLGSQHRRELIGEGLARARRHQRERVTARDRCLDHLLLPGAEVGEAEEPLKLGA